MRRPQIAPSEVKLEPLLDSLRSFGDLGSARQRAPPGSLLQRRLSALVARDAALKAQAEDAFQSEVRAYAAYPKALKVVFHPRQLHLGHLAEGLALRVSPSEVAAIARGRRQREERGKAGAAKRPRRAGEGPGDGAAKAGEGGGAKKRARHAGAGETRRPATLRAQPPSQLLRQEFAAE